MRTAVDLVDLGTVFDLILEVVTSSETNKRRVAIHITLRISPRKS